jgi:VHL beta domain
MNLFLIMKVAFVFAVVVVTQPVCADAALPGCKGLNGLRSQNSDTPTTIRFKNARGQTIRTYWLDFGGVQRFYTTIEPGEIFVQPTYLTHPWIILDEAGNCIGPFMPRKGLREITIR